MRAVTCVVVAAALMAGLVITASAGVATRQAKSHFSKKQLTLLYEMVAYHCKGNLAVCQATFNSTCLPKWYPPTDPKEKAAYDYENLVSFVACAQKPEFSNLDTSQVKIWLQHLEKMLKSESSGKQEEKRPHEGGSGKQEETKPQEQQGGDGPEEPEKDELVEFMRLTNITEVQLLPVMNCMAEKNGKLDLFVSCINS